MTTRDGVFASPLSMLMPLKAENENNLIMRHSETYEIDLRNIRSSSYGSSFDTRSRKPVDVACEVLRGNICDRVVVGRDAKEVILALIYLRYV